MKYDKKINENELSKIVRLLNIFGAIGFVVIFFIINFTNIGSLFTKSVCQTSYLCLYTFTLIIPSYFLIVLIIHYISNKKEPIKRQIKLIIKQVGVSILIYLELTFFYMIFGGIYSRDYFTFIGPDNTTYIAENKIILDSNRFVIKKRSFLFFYTPISNELTGKIPSSYAEISWKDNSNFNLRLSKAKDKYCSYYSYVSPNILEEITKEEYENQNYVKTDYKH